MIYFVFKPRFEECARRWMIKRIVKSIERLEMWEEYDKKKREKRLARKREEDEKKLAAVAAGNFVVTIKNADGTETYKLLDKNDIENAKEEIKPSIADLENQMLHFVKSHDEDFQKLQELRRKEEEEAYDNDNNNNNNNNNDDDDDNDDKDVDFNNSNKEAKEEEKNENENEDENQDLDIPANVNINLKTNTNTNTKTKTKIKIKTKSSESSSTKKKKVQKRHKTNRVAPGQSAKAHVEIPNEFKTITQIAKERLKERQQKAEQDFRERMNKIETVAEKIARGKKNYREKLRHNPMGYQMPLGEHIHPLYGDLEDRIQNMKHCNFLHKVNLSDRNGLRTPKSRTNVIDHWDNKTAISLTSAIK